MIQNTVLPVKSTCLQGKTDLEGSKAIDLWVTENTGIEVCSE
jgi:hypothetical protein